MTRDYADRVAAFVEKQLRYEGRLFEYLTEALRERLASNQASLDELIDAADSLGVDVEIPSDWRTSREREIQAAEDEAREADEEAREARDRLAQLRAYR